MDLDVHEITNGGGDIDDLLRKFSGWSKDQSLAVLDVGIKLLQDTDGEGGGLTSTYQTMSQTNLEKVHHTKNNWKEVENKGSGIRDVAIGVLLLVTG